VLEYGTIVEDHAQAPALFQFDPELVGVEQAQAFILLGLDGEVHMCTGFWFRGHS